MKRLFLLAGEQLHIFAIKAREEPVAVRTGLAAIIAVLVTEGIITPDVGSEVERIAGVVILLAGVLSGRRRVESLAGQERRLVAASLPPLDEGIEPDPS